MGTSARPAVLPFLRHDDLASCRADFEQYREQGFPVYSLKRDEKRHDLLDLLVADHATIIDKQGRIKQTMHGLALAWHYHPLAWTVRCGNRKTPVELFSNDLLFLRAIERRTKLGNAFTDSGLRKILRSFSSTQSVSNFRPTAAAAVYHRLLPESGGAVWDMSAGFGGRLLGALACDRVNRYIGTDPSTYAMDGLREMAAELVPMAEQFGRRTMEVELHKVGSEDFQPERNSLDCAFSSPSYFGWEHYSDEPTQSHCKFPTQESWLHGFIGATLRNCAHGLKRNGILAINIASVAAYPNLTKVFVKFAEDNGWRRVETLHLQLSKMVGLKHIGKSAFKTEPIFVFKKK
ncbi:MAG TPA: hypothetical protein VGR81_13325 [Candidatus Acidoferrales bacterium]|nr:hypothetical protein [Candidatus Acidoferrales bacterium]